MKFKGLMMRCSNAVFGVVADLLEDLTTYSRFNKVRDFEDLVIALSIDREMPMDEVRDRLKEEMSPSAAALFDAVNSDRPSRQESETQAS